MSEARGNPVRIRDCPAAVSGNESRQFRKRNSTGSDQPGKRRPVGPVRPGAHESEDLPAAATTAAREERAMTVTEAAPTRRTQMQVRKRNGDTEPVDVNKIVRAVERWAGGLDDVDPLRVATKTISGLYDGATTAELDRLSIQTAAEMIGVEPQYSRLAARLLSGYIDKEVRNQGIASFSQAIGLGHAEGLIGDDTARFVKDNAR